MIRRLLTAASAATIVAMLVLTGGVVAVAGAGPTTGLDAGMRPGPWSTNPTSFGAGWQDTVNMVRMCPVAACTVLGISSSPNITSRPQVRTFDGAREVPSGTLPATGGRELAHTGEAALLALAAGAVAVVAARRRRGSGR